MDQLRELSKFVTETHAKKVDLIDWNADQEKDNYRKVAENIASNAITTETQIGEIIDANPGTPKFRMFKSRLKDKLLNGVLLYDAKDDDKTPYHKALMICGRNVYLIKVLITFSLTKTAEKLAKSTLNKALEFELFDAAFFCSGQLRRLSSYAGNEDEFLHYHHFAEQYLDRVLKENRAYFCLESLYARLANTNIYKSNQIELAVEKLKEVSGLYDRCPTYQTGLFYYRVKVIYEELQENYKAALETWEEFEKYIERFKDFEYKVRISEIAIQQLYCHLCIGDYKEGQKSALKCETFYSPHSNNWYLYKEYFFLLSMHTGRYDHAFATLQQVISGSLFKSLTNNRLEKWRIFEAYNYIIQRSLNKNGIEAPLVSKFKLSKFLNETPIYNKDKEGFNTSILIIQIMILILDDKYDELAEKVTALKLYTNRYLQKDSPHKSFIFIKMIILADKCAYNYEQTSKATEELFEELKKKRYMHSNSYEGLEIVPYAHLWEVVLKCIKNQELGIRS